MRRGHLRLTPSFLQTDEYRHGPCYVLCPVAWMRGERVVLEVIEPAREGRAQRKREPMVVGFGIRRMVVWPPGEPLNWRLVNVPVQQSEPRWASRARKLRALGWSIRRIMKELGVRNRREMDGVLES